MRHDFQEDIDAVQSIAAVPTILDVVCQATGMGFAAVARVTEDRWIACQVLDKVNFGLPAGGELKVETTLCHEVRQQRQVVVFDDAAEDSVYAGHHTPAIYGLRSYISVPIVLPDGSFFGTLCAIDPNPAKVNNPQILGTFKLFAELIAYHLDAARKLQDTRKSLLDEKASSELREQFIAILGHDLRNPLASLNSGTDMLAKRHDDPASVHILHHMRASIVRMGTLIDDVMDFARGRLGGGMALELAGDRPIKPTLVQVVDEIRTAHPHRLIETRIGVLPVVDVDHSRISQMFSNLLGNAITHGADDRPILIEAAIVDGVFELAVANGGEPIPEAAMERVFQPFYRGHVRPNLQGLGLGLYIASQIAQAHGGRLDVKSDKEETRFTFRMPIQSSSAT